MTFQGDHTQREALARIVASRLGDLSHDELRVVDKITSRMIGVGREKYGALVLSRESRDWRNEGSAELADFVFYAACREIAANDARLERLRCEVADENAQPVDTRLKAALVEFRDSTPTAPRALMEFEMPDLGGDV